jgi:hypothetical protein
VDDLGLTFYGLHLLVDIDLLACLSACVSCVSAYMRMCVCVGVCVFNSLQPYGYTDECQYLASIRGASILSPYSIGRTITSSDKTYHLASRNQCNSYTFVTAVVNGVFNPGNPVLDFETQASGFRSAAR